MANRRRRAKIPRYHGIDTESDTDSDVQLDNLLPGYPFYLDQDVNYELNDPGGQNYPEEEQNVGVVDQNVQEPYEDDIEDEEVLQQYDDQIRRREAVRRQEDDDDDDPIRRREDDDDDQIRRREEEAPVRREPVRRREDDDDDPIPRLEPVRREHEDPIPRLEEEAPVRRQEDNDPIPRQEDEVRREEEAPVRREEEAPVRREEEADVDMMEEGPVNDDADAVDMIEGAFDNEILEVDDGEDEIKEIYRSDDDDDESESEPEFMETDDYNTILNFLIKQWMDIELKHDVSKVASEAFWSLSKTWFHRMFQAKENQNVRRKTPNFVHIRRQLHKQHVPPIHMEFAFQHKETGQITFAQDAITPRARFPHHEFFKLWEIAHVEVKIN